MVSPPNYHCFFNSLFAFVRLFVDLQTGETIQDQFSQLTSVIEGKYPDGFIPGPEMVRIAQALNVTIICEMQFRTMLKNRALGRIDLTRPVLLKLNAADYIENAGDTGHVGFLVPHHKTKKILF